MGLHVEHPMVPQHFAGSIGVILGLYWGFLRGNIRVILGLSPSTPQNKEQAIRVNEGSFFMFWPEVPPPPPS